MELIDNDGFMSPASNAASSPIKVPVQIPSMDVPSSPMRYSKNQSNKPKARPTVTPRTFTRFFTPRPSRAKTGRVGASRQALRDITAAAANQKSNPRLSSRQQDSIRLFEDADDIAIRARKRRKACPPISSETTPDRSSPLKRISANTPKCLNENGSDSGSDQETYDTEDDNVQYKTTNQPKVMQRVEPIVRSRIPGVVHDLLYRQSGLGTTTQQRSPLFNGQDWQYETSNFYTTPKDRHVCDNLGDPTEHAMPFCAVGCNRNSLMAIGDEEGGIRLLETARFSKPHFHKAYLTFRPHSNAILDLAFSPDDLLLATASGDQTSQIIDMPTQRAICTLAIHSSSLKQVMFQPGSSSVIATSSRDGNVGLWDLRCKGSERPVRDLRISLDGPESGHTSGGKTIYGAHIDAIMGAHASRASLPSPNMPKVAEPTTTHDVPSKTERPSRRGDVSITAMAFLQADREHLLVTASEADATVKLWDLRTTHSRLRTGYSVALSSTQQPHSHTKHRHFGITSMALGGDSGRIYTLCRDNTVYAYSTAHLILGNAPELDRSNTSHSLGTRRSRFAHTTEKEGLGPIYGFRHPQMHATTFYVRLAVRPAKDDQSELLAVGSSDGCAVVWPTDERYMRHHDVDTGNRKVDHSGSGNPYATPPTSAALSRPPLSRFPSSRLGDTIPIYSHGTPLVRGHSREVTAVSWAHGGEFVSVSDDFTVRCWREDAERARGLRTQGEGEGRRWGCGWADVDEKWDDLR
ncbi:MAG: hypothetical protein Q9220_000715 [cf. Caloplaca sp. 1 TL-2023]